jgi:hypothetical protein
VAGDGLNQSKHAVALRRAMQKLGKPGKGFCPANAKGLRPADAKGLRPADAIGRIPYCLFPVLPEKRIPAGSMAARS